MFAEDEARVFHHDSLRPARDHLDHLDWADNSGVTNERKCSCYVAASCSAPTARFRPARHDRSTGREQPGPLLPGHVFDLSTEPEPARSIAQTSGNCPPNQDRRVSSLPRLRCVRCPPGICSGTVPGGCHPPLSWRRGCSALPSDSRAPGGACDRRTAPFRRRFQPRVVVSALFLWGDPDPTPMSGRKRERLR